MSVKVLIERRTKPDCFSDVLERSIRLRSLALRQNGYVSGETLVAADRDDTHLVISSWRSLDDWKAWETNPERIAIS